MIVAAILRAFNGAVNLDQVLTMRVDVARELMEASRRINERVARDAATEASARKRTGRYRITSVADIEKLRSTTGGSF